MTSLNRFLETIKIAGATINGGYTGYKMDATGPNSMRAAVGLGSCHCCDYFLSGDKFITLLEETCLLETVRNIRRQYKYLNDQHKDDAVNKGIVAENQLKAYGAMLVLCRLAAKCSDAKNLIRDKQFRFWLVASHIDSDEEKMFFDNMKDSLRGDMRQIFGKVLLGDTDIFSSDSLKERLSS